MIVLGTINAGCPASPAMQALLEADTGIGMLDEQGCPMGVSSLSESIS